jgi:hypothetical protein
MQTQPTSLMLLNVAMLIGITPLWLAGFHFWLANDQYQSQGAGIALMFAGMFTYGFAVIVGGIAALWSISISNKIGQEAGLFTVIMRSAVALTLIVPWFIVGSL